MMTYRTIVAVVLLLTLLSGCRLDEHQSDWKKVSDAATEFGKPDVIEAARIHLHTYPGCEHRAAAEYYFVQSCAQSYYSTHDFCADYFETFPNGERMAEVEEILWQRCRESTLQCGDYVRHFPKGSKIAEVENRLWDECVRGLCSSYVSLFPNGRHIADARARADGSRRQDEESRTLEDARMKAAWSGPKIQVALTLPPSADHRGLTVSMMGKELASGYDYGVFEVPAAFTTVDVCYSNSGNTYSGDTKTCAKMTLHPGSNEVPLSSLRVATPEGYDLLCRVGSDYHSFTVKGTLETGLFFMPGTHTISCNVLGPQYADDAQGALVKEYADDVEARFEASDEGGYVNVYYIPRGPTVGAVVRYSKF